MIAATRSARRLIDRLPDVRGSLTAEAALLRFTWFRVGGPAEVLFEPADRDDLMAFRAALPDDVPVTVIGVASNLLIRDGGVPGIVVRLGRPFAGIAIEQHEVRAGAGALDIQVARAAQKAGLAGLEFLVGVPGTIGGGLRMNAGAYGREIEDVIVSAEAVDAAGRVHRLAPDELGFGYRHSAVPGDWIFTQAVLRGTADAPAAIAARMKMIADEREASQPLRTRTGGSTFKNPAKNPGKNPDGAKAWELVAAAGCRGLQIGGARVSDKHCNFLVNTGQATAAEIEALGEEVRRRVRAQSGVDLEWEIRRIGVPLAGGRG